MKRGLYPGTAEAIEKFGEGFLVKHTVTLRTDAVGTQTLFNVTGEVEVIVIGYIDTTVTSGGALTLEVGVLGATDGLIAQTAVGDLTEGKIWVDASPSVLKAKPSWKIIANGLDIIHTIGTAAATGGKITYYCWWRPLSADGKVTVP